MTFDDLLAQVLDLLQRQGRVSYRALKRRFNLDDEYLEDLEAELIEAQDDSPDDKLRKLEKALALTPSPLRGERVGVRGSDWQPVPSLTPALSQREERLEMVPLFAALLSLPLPERCPALSMPPQRQKQKTMEAVLRVLQVLAARQPVLFIVEDLHWGDPSTLELLSLLIDQGPTARILTLLVFRPEFRPPWGFRAYVTPMTLARLPHQQTEALVERVVGGKGLPAEVRQQIVAKTDGVPLFVEELTKLVLESGLLRERAGAYELTGPLPSLAIPATLHDSLMARLDRLATVKEVAQLAPPWGGRFPMTCSRRWHPGMTQRCSMPWHA